MRRSFLKAETKLKFNMLETEALCDKTKLKLIS